MHSNDNIISVRMEKDEDGREWKVTTLAATPTFRSDLLFRSHIRKHSALKGPDPRETRRMGEYL
jgi:hypothetical protein